MLNGFHRYVGLVLGAWLTLMGLTGLVLVFHNELDGVFNGRLARVDHLTPKPDLDRLAAIVKAKHPDRALLLMERAGVSDYESYPFILSRRLPMTATGPDLSRLGDPDEALDLEVFVDPQDGTILGQRPYHTALRTLMALHEDLLLGKRGQPIVGGLGLLAFLSVVAGVVVWFQQNGKRPAKSLKLNIRAPTPKLMRDIHMVVGVYIALFLGLQTLSGAAINNYFPVSRWVEGLFTASKPVSPFAARPPAHEGPGIGANEARDIALAIHPASDPLYVQFPVAGRPNWSVRLFPRDQSKTRHLRQALITPTGEVVYTFDPDAIPYPGRIPMAFSIWIHNGQFWGLPGRLIVLLTGLCLTLFFPTGLYLWLRRRRMQRARG